MENLQQHKMATEPVGKLFWKMGLPMIVSMVLQALYNVIDSIFVANMKGTGALANEALTIAFPVQIMIIAISVGTGVDINALLSKNLGEHNDEKVNAVAEKYIRGELPLCGIIRKRLPPSFNLKSPEHLKSGTPLFAEEVADNVAFLPIVQDERMCAPVPEP